MPLFQSATLSKPDFSPYFKELCKHFCLRNPIPCGCSHVMRSLVAVFLSLLIMSHFCIVHALSINGEKTLLHHLFGDSGSGAYSSVFRRRFLLIYVLQMSLHRLLTLLEGILFSTQER